MGWQVDWNSASLDSRVYLSLSAAELEFHRISLVERSKLQWTGAGTSDNLVGGRYSTKAARKAAGRSQISPQPQSSSLARSTGAEIAVVVVVTLVLLLRGRSGTYRCLSGLLPVLFLGHRQRNQDRRGGVPEPAGDDLGGVIRQ